MADQSVTCTSCGQRIPLTRALQADLETSLRTEFESVFAARERELHETFSAHLQRAEAQAGHSGEQRMAAEIEALQEQLTDQARMVSEMRALEVALRKRERELQQEKQELELSVVRQIDLERAAIVEETRARIDDQHRLKDVERERQLADMRRQIEDLKRRAEQDPDYIACMEDVLNVLARPYDPPEPVVSLDERPVVLGGTRRPGRPMGPGRVARQDYEYVRHGTANIYCIVEPKAGRHLTHGTRDRRAPQFVRAL